MTGESDAYERFVAALAENVQKSGRSISDLSSGANNKIVGASGQPHQIDVSFVDSSFPTPRLVLIECKYHGRPIDNSVVKVLQATIRDILENPDTPADVSGIIVSSAPFQSGARTLGKHWSIDLHTVPPEPPFSFHYENILQESLADHLGLTDHAECQKMSPDQ